MKNIIITALCMLVPASPAILILLHTMLPSLSAEVLFAGLAAVHVSALGGALVAVTRADQAV